MPNKYRANTLRIVAFVQAALCAALSLVAVAVFGLGLLFALSWQPRDHVGRHDVLLAAALAAGIVLPPILLTATFLVAATRMHRCPRSATVTMLVGEVAGAAFVLWPQLRPLIFALPPISALAVVDLAATLPAVVLAVLALTSDDARAALPGPGRADPASSTGRRS